MSAVKFVLAILLPPVSVFLNEGIGVTLIINILLTLVGWIPGSIHALWLLTKRA